jgi:hypothetical protein
VLLAGIAQATEQLGGMFWPESTEPPAQATLRCESHTKCAEAPGPDPSLAGTPKTSREPIPHLPGPRPHPPLRFGDGHADSGGPRRRGLRRSRLTSPIDVADPQPLPRDQEKSQ